MRMKFLRKLIADRFENVPNQLASAINVPPQKVHQWLKDTAQGMRIEYLCRLRNVSGKSWEQFGRDLDAEFLLGELPKPSKRLKKD